MRSWFHKALVLAGLMMLGVSLSTAEPPAKSSSHSVSKSSKAAHHSRKKSRKTRGQQAIDSERCREIQNALVRAHYMSGQPSGKWDETTQAAMRRYQADQGWQSKSIPDSRALIRLGLGPDHGHLLNPESAMTTQPQLSHGTSVRTKAAASSSSAVTPAQASSPTSLPGQSSTTAPISGSSEVSPQR
jgi:peptidoglycan hydrolase-like protein with peptidoglycan-binding domain